MNEDLKYRISLEDLFSKGIQSAEAHAQGFERAVDGIKEHLSAMAMQMVAAAGIFEVFELGKSSLTAYEDLSKANAQLAASLKSTGEAAGLTREELKKQSEELENNSLFDGSTITKMQSVLLTFTGIKKEIFNDTETAIANLSTKMGEDLQSATVQIGKALQDPIRGITALRRVGVNFSDSQKEVIKSLVDTGKTAEAQRLILKELNTEFGGSASAAMGAAPMENMAKQMHKIKEEIGEQLMPYVIKLFTAFKDGIEWIKKNTDTLKQLGVAIGVAASAVLLYNGYVFVMNSYNTIAATIAGVKLVAALTEQTAAQIALNFAMDANPIGIVIVAVAALAAAIYSLKLEYDSIIDSYKKAGDELQENAITKEATQVNNLIAYYQSLGKTRKEADEMAIDAANKLTDAKIAQLKVSVDLAQIAMADFAFQKVSNPLKFFAQGKEEIANLLAARGALSAAIAQKNSLSGIKTSFLTGATGAKGDLGSELNEPKASKIQNITINMPGVLSNMKNTYATMELGVDDFMGKLSKALNAVVLDAAVIASE